MKKFLAITVALMIAAIVLMPALGYTNQAAGNQGYTAITGDKVASNFTTGVPAHNLTPMMIQAIKSSFKSAAVQSTRMTYSFKTGTATPSFKQPAVENAAMLGMKTKKPVANLGSVNKIEEATPLVIPATATVNETAAAPLNETATATVNETATAPLNETVISPANDTAPGNVTVTAAINATN